MTKFFKKHITITLIAFFILCGSTAQAENKLDIEYLSGSNINEDNLFKADHIYPGWSKSETIRITNESKDDEVNLYFNFKTKEKSRLAKKLKIYVIRKSDNNYRIGGEGDRKNLKEINNGNLYTDHLDPEESSLYKIKIVFDKDAGNEYQGKSVKFNLNFKIEERVNEDATEEEIFEAQGRADFTGLPPEESNEKNQVTVENQDNSEVAGAQSESTDENIMGAQDSCQSWSLKTWILILIAYFTIFNFNNFYKLSANHKKIRWFWQLTYTALTIVIWYLFDNCRYFTWLPIVTVLLGAGSYEYYLYRVKQKIQKS